MKYFLVQIVECVQSNDHTEDVRIVTQRVVQIFTTGPSLLCLWR